MDDLDLFLYTCVLLVSLPDWEVGSPTYRQRLIECFLNLSFKGNMLKLQKKFVTANHKGTIK